MAYAGEGYKLHFTGLTHDETGIMDLTAERHEKLTRRLIEKIESNADDIIRYEEYSLDDAKIVVVSFGCTARSARRAVRDARAQGIPVGMLRLISLWPFPEKIVKELAESADEFIVAEMNLGQMSREVERLIRRPVRGVHYAGGAMIRPETILEAIKEAAHG
jgi:2-oxoglutarate ferredoxin oxidoreductase subunit alpha